METLISLVELTIFHYEKLKRIHGWHIVQSSGCFMLMGAVVCLKSFKYGNNGMFGGVVGKWMFQAEEDTGVGIVQTFGCCLLMSALS